MGNGNWSDTTHSASASYRKATGASAFDYSDRIMARTPYAERQAHVTLNPLGVKVRESRDSTEHPSSNAVMFAFDVTGSMAGAPREMQVKLPGLFGTVLRYGYLPDPQIAFGAIGDAECDRVPLQIGQFESDNRIEETLGNIYLEGGGGGNNGESYGMALYFAARHTSLDCWEKRGRRGYLFLTGDELPLEYLTPAQIKMFIGDDVQGNISIQQLVTEAQKSFHVFFLHINNRTAQIQGSLAKWQKLLAGNVVSLQGTDAICETVSLLIGLTEGAIDSVDTGARHLASSGSSKSAIKAATGALVRYRPSASALAGHVTGTLPDTTDRSRRL